MAVESASVERSLGAEQSSDSRGSDLLRHFSRSKVGAGEVAPTLFIFILIMSYLVILEFIYLLLL